jgi:hypothetical protein
MRCLVPTARLDSTQRGEQFPCGNARDRLGHPFALRGEPSLATPSKVPGSARAGGRGLPIFLSRTMKRT